MALDASSTEEARIALSAAGPIPNAVLYNNAKDLAAAMVAAGVTFGGGGSGGGVPVGTILHTGQSVIPAGFLDCDGSSQLRSLYPDLFDAIGTTYGAGAVPGTTFALPTVTGTYGNFVICADAAAIVVETQSLIGAPIGTLLLYAVSPYPTGWLRADGTAISRTTYADLFAILGTTYGAGDGSTTFNLPNLLSSGSPSPVYIIKAILSGSVEPSTVAHASSHIRAGTDVIDGDRVQIDYVPSAYTRDAAAAGAGAVTDLTAHLGGINNKFAFTTAASGGTEGTYLDESGATYKYHIFNSTANLTVTTAGNVIALVVAGGGGGGGCSASAYSAGGGGGGGVLYSALTLTTGTYTATVGSGGVGGSTAGARGTIGNNSSFSSLTAIGGGGGGSFGTPTGITGGSGGGAGGGSTANSGGAGTSGQGSSGGDKPAGGAAPYGAPGGGGASEPGQSTHGGVGGAGLIFNMVGRPAAYGGGGGGGCEAQMPGAGGLGGGGTGGTTFSVTTIPSAGRANTGGGGGGGGGNAAQAGGYGGSGVVIIKYRIS